MKDRRNYDSKYKDYFINNIDYNSQVGFLKKISLSAQIVYSTEAKSKITALINDQQPDIAHLHIFQHQISPSILYALKNRKIPIVYTAHDLKCVCGNYKFFSNGSICEKCIHSNHIHCLLNKCVKGSYAKSFISTLEMFTHRVMRAYDLIDVIITPSMFYREKFIEAGFNKEKVIYLPNFLDYSVFEPNYNNKNYFIYLGRLSNEKGIITTLEAVSRLSSSAVLKIIGTGPMEDEIKSFIASNKLERKVEVLGYKSGKELGNLIRDAMFGIIPSEWYENAPYSLLEMMAYGKPVIGSDIGGIPELIENGKTGLIFKTGDADDLSEKVSCLLDNKELLYTFGINARKKLELEFNSSIHYEKLIDIYKRLVNKNKISEG